MSEKKSYYSQSTNKATQKYKAENLQEVRFWVRKGEREKLQEEARRSGESSTARYIIKAVNDRAGYELLSMPKDKLSKEKATNEE